MATWQQKLELKQAIWKRKQKLGPNVSSNGDTMKPFDAAKSASKDKRIGLPLNFHSVKPKQFRKSWKSGSGCVMSDTARAAVVQRQGLRALFLASLAS